MNDQPVSESGLLEPLDERLLPASTEPFIVRNQFKNTNGVRFATVWQEFKQRFLDKVEKPAPEVKMRKYKLLKIAPDEPIIAELGGEKKVESTLGAAFACLQRQSAGEQGFLQTNGFANIFYVRDKQGVLCAIRIGWAEDGWVVDAVPVADPLAWNGQHAIFCPIS